MNDVNINVNNNPGKPEIIKMILFSALMIGCICPEESEEDMDPITLERWMF